MKDTTQTLRNLKRDILAIQIPLSCDTITVKIVRDAVISEISKTIKRKE